MPRTAAPLTAATGRRGAARISARRRAPRLVAAGLTAVAALTLGACAEEQRLKTVDTPRFDPAPQDAHDPAARGSQKGATGGEATGAHPACDTSHLDLTATPLSRPTGHLLLTAKNTSDTSCELYGYPRLTFGDARSPVAGPQGGGSRATVTLGPGASGYAAVRPLAADGTDGSGPAVTSLKLRLAGPDGSAEAGGSARVPLTGGAPRGAHIGGDARTTPWETDRDAATDG